MNHKYLIGLVLIFSGCSAVSHLEELKTLQGFSKEVEKTDAYVEAYDASFDRLMTAVKDQSIDQYPNKEAILENFVEPIERKVIMRNGVAYEEWLYRRAVYFFESAKVYLVFDQNDQLVNYRHEPGSE